MKLCILVALPAIFMGAASLGVEPATTQKAGSSTRPNSASFVATDDMIASEFSKAEMVCIGTLIHLGIELDSGQKTCDARVNVRRWLKRSGGVEVKFVIIARSFPLDQAEPIPEVGHEYIFLLAHTGEELRSTLILEPTEK